MKNAHIREWINERWLAIDQFTELEQEIADNLNLAKQCGHASDKATPHPADAEFADKAMRTAIEQAQQYTELAMRHNKSKLTTLAKVVNSGNANIKQESVPRLIVGKLLLDYLDAHDELPSSREALASSASNECRADIAEQKLPTSQLFTRGLEYYELADKITDKPGRKS